MHNPINVFFIIAILAFVIWRKTMATRKPIKGNGLRLLYPLLIPVLIGPELFIGKAGQLGSPISLIMLVGALVIGAIFSIPLVLTTNYEIREDGLIYAIKNKSFTYVLIGLILLRVSLRTYLGGIDPFTLTKLMFLMASVYLIIWRVSSFIKFRRIWINKAAIQVVD